MIVLGSNSEVAQAFVEKVLSEGERFPHLYLLSSNPAEAQKFANHIDVKYIQPCEIIPFNLEGELNFQSLEKVQSRLLFCASGFLGKGADEGMQDHKDTRQILDINFSKLVPVLNFFAHKMESQRGGTMVVLSSVAGDRGRQSNFIYGSAKAGLTAYLSGLRNYMSDKKVHVLTVKPGFMDTKMTEGLPLNPSLTATPFEAAEVIYKAYKKRRNVAYVLPVWWFIMLVIKHIPEFIFKKMKL